MEMETPSSQTPSFFPQFSSSRMPPEVCDLIWSQAISLTPGRIITVTQHTTPITTLMSSKAFNYFVSPRDHGRCRPLVEIKHAYHYSSPSPIPALLETTFRSRQLAEKRWAPALGVKKNGDGISRVRFDAKSDILLFSSRNALNNLATLLDNGQRGEICNLAFDLRAMVDDYKMYNDHGQLLGGVLFLFDHLETIYFNVGDYSAESGAEDTAKHSVTMRFRTAQRVLNGTEKAYIEQVKASLSSMVEEMPSIKFVELLKL